jgi:hypothetical protein
MATAFFIRIQSIILHELLLNLSFKPGSMSNNIRTVPRLFLFEKRLNTPVDIRWAKHYPERYYLETQDSLRHP